ncbi:MAG: ribosome silencing factor [Acidimicrobiia bacterium]|nr:ribosome silencing factor [Acidimicrobiia bacterium]
MEVDLIADDSLAAELAIMAAEAIDDKKGTDVTLLDVSEILRIVDVFVIATGTNRRQVQALADAVEERLRDLGRRPLRVEGRSEAEWALLDYGDIVVHLFQPAVREFYSLERLWGDAPKLEWNPTPVSDTA